MSQYACVLNGAFRRTVKKGSIFKHPVKGIQLAPNSYTDELLLSELDLVPLGLGFVPTGLLSTEKLVGPVFRYDEQGEAVYKDYSRAFISASKIQGMIQTENESLFTTKMRIVRGATNPDEIGTWDQQVSEARSYLADANTVVPMLESLATLRGILLADLVDKIIDKATSYAAVVGALLGRKQAIDDLTEASELDAEELSRIYHEELTSGWPF